MIDLTSSIDVSAYDERHLNIQKGKLAEQRMIVSIH